MAITISGENNNDRITAQDGVIDTISGFNISGIITASSFTGDLTGDVTGNLTGNVTGNINNSTLLLQVGGTEKLRLNSDRVIIGQTLSNNQPTYNSSTTFVTTHTNNSSAWNAIAIISGNTTGASFLKFGDRDDEDVSQIGHYNDDNSLRFYTNGGNERLRIDSSGRVLIGTTTEGFAEADDLTINSADHGGITIRTPTNKEGNIAFSDTTSGTGEYSGLIRYRHSSNDLGLWTNSSLRLLIDSSGNLGLGIDSPQRLLHQHVDNSFANYHIFTNSTTGSSASDGLLLGINSTEDAVIWNQENTHLRFATSGTERLRIKSDGLVGIGIETPQRLLHQHINSSGATYHAFTNTTTGSGITDGMVVGISGAEEAIFWNYEATAMRFATSGTERLRIDGGGGMQLGTSTATASKLTVYGANDAAAIFQGSGTGTGAGNGLLVGNNGGTTGLLWNYENGNTLFATNNIERLRITSDGKLGIGTVSPAVIHHLYSASGGLYTRFEAPQGQVNFGNSNGAGIIHVTSTSQPLRVLVNGTNERLRITSDGSIGINETTPSAGDLATGDSQNTPIIHVKGSGTSATGGEYNLLARFEAGGDADGTGAMIVLNHSNDRGLAIQGGRRTGNYAHGALKMIDNVGRVSDAMLIHGGAGQGVDHINFYTGVSTTTTNRLHIDSSGRVLIGTTNNSNGHIAASKAAVHGHLAIFKDSEGDNAGVNSHQLKFVTQSGSISEIQATSNGAGGPAGRGGYLSFFAKENNNATLKEMVRVRTDYLHVLRENTSLEGGQIGLSRASDNAAYWMIDSYGSSSTPDFRLHAGGTSHFSINSSGQWVDAPPGTIIQVGYARYDPNTDNYVTISQDTRASSSVYLDFTPRRSDSKLIIMTRMHTRMIAAFGCSYGIEQSTNSGSSYSDVDGMYQRNAMDFFFKGDSVNHHFTGFCMRQIDSYTGSRRFRPWGQGWSGGTWEISYGHGEHSVTIYEVAV